MVLLPLALMAALTSLFSLLVTPVAGMPGIAPHASLVGRDVGKQAELPLVTLTPNPSPGARERGDDGERPGQTVMSSSVFAGAGTVRKPLSHAPGEGFGVRVFWRNAAVSSPHLPLPTHAWEMDSYTLGDAAQVDVAEPAHYTAQFFPDGQAKFVLDCNSGRGGFTATDGDFALTNLATTDALCPPGSYSDAFATLLTSANHYRFDETGNLILRGSQGALRMRPALTGVTWVWQGVAANDGTIFVAPPAPERYTLEFQPGGDIAIRADCNRARARARTEGIVLDIAVGGVTRMACLPDSLGGPFLVALGDVETWYLFNGTLSLTLPDGAGMMIFTPVATPPAVPPGAE